MAKIDRYFNLPSGSSIEFSTPINVYFKGEEWDLKAAGRYNKDYVFSLIRFKNENIDVQIVYDEDEILFPNEITEQNIKIQKLKETEVGKIIYGK